jgi:hypothetical protein
MQGEFVFRLGGQERAARASDELAATKGTPHTFRCVGSEAGAMDAFAPVVARLAGT